jgi:hypothetical protein
MANRWRCSNEPLSLMNEFHGPLSRMNERAPTERERGIGPVARRRREARNNPRKEFPFPTACCFSSPLHLAVREHDN